ncbi:hypothetical protein [Xenorhabdus bovienii]|uniref:hypothetical protein n=1 Tax=Xenorhabdus bovienii TaxID=40576 RepID=UPI0023B2F405|nr:hypothetical protein [Xenorhabdus bovienii]MDE9541067.1 hypothetical protein [Xenorhabdus bovienii]
MQQLTLEFADQRISLTGHDAILKKVLSTLSPFFKTYDDCEPKNISCYFMLNPVENIYSLLQGLNIELDYERPYRLPPVLITDESIGEGIRILRYTKKSKIILYEKTVEQDTILIEINEDGQVWNVSYQIEDVLQYRTISRAIKYVVGCLLYKKGCQFFHASGINYQENNYIFYGRKGSGKTSNMFKSCVHLGADFISDDTIVVWLSDGKLTFSGWPKRVGLNLSAISNDNIDRLNYDFNRSQNLDYKKSLQYVGKHLPPEQRKRIEMDAIEFLQIFTVKYSSNNNNAMFINLDFDIRHEVNMKSSSLDTTELFMEEKNKKYFIDYLSLTPDVNESIEADVMKLLHQQHSYYLSYGAASLKDTSFISDLINLRVNIS